MSDVFERAEKLIQERHLKLDNISSEIKRTEVVLKKLAGPFYTMEIDNFSLYWSSSSKRIFLENENLESRPFIECKAETRIKYFPYLKKFLEKYLDILNEGE